MWCGGRIESTCRLGLDPALGTRSVSTHGPARLTTESGLLAMVRWRRSKQFRVDLRRRGDPRACLRGEGRVGEVGRAIGHGNLACLALARRASCHSRRLARRARSSSVRSTEKPHAETRMTSGSALSHFVPGEAARHHAGPGRSPSRPYALAMISRVPVPGAVRPGRAIPEAPLEGSAALEILSAIKLETSPRSRSMMASASRRSRRADSPTSPEHGEDALEVRRIHALDRRLSR